MPHPWKNLNMRMWENAELTRVRSAYLFYILIASKKLSCGVGGAFQARQDFSGMPQGGRVIESTCSTCSKLACVIPGKTLTNAQ